MSDPTHDASPLRGEDPIQPLERDHVEALLGRLRAAPRGSARFRAIRELGRGGMGVVLEVRDPELRRPLALKRMNPRRADEPDATLRQHFLARFLQEAQVTGQLEHPGIPPVHEFSVDEDGPYFTMPVIRGQDLDEVFRRARAGDDGWSIPRALTVLLKVCEALSFAHAKGVVHRDLKPANVRIGRFGEVYVMDWGLARIAGRDEPDPVRWSASGALSSVHTDREQADGSADRALQTLDGDVLGTPYYMAPEQARGDLARVGPRTDVYAVGGLLYLLLSGRAPYEPDQGRISPRTVLAAVLHGPPPALSAIAPGADPDLVAICRQAMERDAGRRYADMEALASDLRAWQERRPIVAAEPSFLHALALFCARHRAAVTTAAVALALLLVSTGLYVWRITQESRAKEVARAEAQRRGDALVAAALRLQADELWPAVPDRIPALEAWLARVAELEARLPSYRAVARAAPSVDREEAEALLATAQALPGLKRGVEQRLAFARTLRHITIDGQRTAWEQASAAIASSPAYGGLRVEPQLGLVPLGPDAASGLFEFWHVASGERPEPGSVRAADGIVLVLLPAVTWTYGVPDQGRNWQPGAQLAELDLEPFLCAKHELTQAQWSRVAGANPARFQPGSALGATDCPTCPVENVTWSEAHQLLARLDLRLPTEYEWEYGALGSREAPAFSHGPTTEALEGLENVRDAVLGPGPDMPAAPWTDGFPNVAPIGSFPPNRVGLHDALGNVAEWTADLVRPYGAPLPEATTVVEVRAFRGGSWYQAPRNCAPRIRQWDSARAVNYARGLRAARSLSR
ncbi:MAG: SUMF1/EgtB/PvdO family nonheme iron enzyme [Planctomycetes bacterium]|nr:SUMF1/EgtB/PvdO family nonheme iron enzyme [Planctomycetota bacterium]